MPQPPRISFHILRCLVRMITPTIRHATPPNRSKREEANTSQLLTSFQVLLSCRISLCLMNDMHSKVPAAIPHPTDNTTHAAVSRASVGRIPLLAKYRNQTPRDATANANMATSKDPYWIVGVIGALPELSSIPLVASAVEITIRIINQNRTQKRAATRAIFISRE